MKKAVLIALILAGVAVFGVIFALSGRGGKDAGSGYIKKITAEAVSADVHLESITHPGKTVQLYAAKVENKLPAGTYKVKNIALTVEKDGDKWWMQSGRPSPELEKIEVKAGQTTELVFGPPLVIKTDVNTKDDVVSVGLSIFGRANERYHPALRKNDQQQPAPGLKIVDEAGKVLAAGNFEYG